MSENDWRSTGWFIEAKGSRHLFARIGAIGGFSSEARIVWRGFSSIDYPLTSSLQRQRHYHDEAEMRRDEAETLAAAREWGLGFRQYGWASDLQLLADLQHYGTSTRLIDVSNNPMTALWFACQRPSTKVSGREVSTDGLLLAINTVGWPHYGRGNPGSSYSALERPLSWELEEALSENVPFVVESLLPNDRMKAQEGLFLAAKIPPRRERVGPFHSFRINYEQTASQLLEAQLTERPLSTHPRPEALPFVALKIPARMKQRILERLANSYNRNASVLFPDFEGFKNFSGVAVPREDEGPVLL